MQICLGLFFQPNMRTMVSTSITVRRGSIYQNTTQDTALLSMVLSLRTQASSLAASFIALGLFLQLNMRTMVLTSITTENNRIYQNTTQDTALFRIILPHLIQASPQVVSSIACVHIYTLTDIYLTAPTSISPEFVQGSSSGIFDRFIDIDTEANYFEGPSPYTSSC